MKPRNRPQARPGCCRGVVQAGLGAEFYIPIGVEAVPLSVEATYRLVQPLNPEAEHIHAVLGQIGFHF